LRTIPRYLPESIHKMKTYTELARELSRTLSEKLTHAEFELLVDMMGDNTLDTMLFRELYLEFTRRRTTTPPPPPEQDDEPPSSG
jgi:hypothetical protein